MYRIKIVTNISHNKINSVYYTDASCSIEHTITVCGQEPEPNGTNEEPAPNYDDEEPKPNNTNEKPEPNDTNEKPEPNDTNEEPEPNASSLHPWGFPQKNIFLSEKVANKICLPTKKPVVGDKPLKLIPIGKSHLTMKSFAEDSEPDPGNIQHHNAKNRFNSYVADLLKTIHKLKSDVFVYDKPTSFYVDKLNQLAKEITLFAQEQQNMDVASNSVNSNDVNSNSVNSNDVNSNDVNSNDVNSNDVASNSVNSNDVASNSVAPNEVASNNVVNHISISSDPILDRVQIDLL